MASVLECAAALGSGVPADQLQLHLRLQSPRLPPDARDVPADALHGAACRAVATSLPFFCELLDRTGTLPPAPILPVQPPPLADGVQAQETTARRATPEATRQLVPEEQACAR